MGWPTVSHGHYDTESGEFVYDEFREPNLGEKTLIVATSPIWGIFALAGKINQTLDNWQEEHRKAEEERLAQEAAEAERVAALAEEYRLAEEARAKEDHEIFQRTNQLLALDIGGCIATIAKQYENYTSTWEYRCTMDNLIIRTRGGDKATVCFHDSNEMMEDLQRYRWAGFELV